MVKRLGEILIERGALALSELHTGLETCRRSGGRLGTQLLKFGFVDEHALLEALAEQYGVRSVESSTLAKAPIDVLSLLPVGRARRLGAVPFERTAHHVCVATINPRDALALGEIAEATGLDVVPFVATETAILEAIARLEGDPGRAEPGQLEPATDWDQLWLPPRVQPKRLLELRRPPSVPSTSPVQLATFPGLASLDGDQSAADVAHSIDEATLRQQLASVQDRDEVGRLILRYAQGFFSRVCLFAVHHGSVIGWMAQGNGVVVDDVQAFSLPLDEGSPFHEFRFGSGYHLGPVPESEVSDSLVRLFGDPKPQSVLLVPIRVRDRAVAFVLGDNPHEEVVLPVDEVASALAAAGMAFEILILRKKITG